MVLGAGRAERRLELVRAVGGTAAFVVSDGGLVAAGLVGSVVAGLERAGRAHRASTATSRRTRPSRRWWREPGPCGPSGPGRSSRSAAARPSTPPRRSACRRRPRARARRSWRAHHGRHGDRDERLRRHRRPRGGLQALRRRALGAAPLAVLDPALTVSVPAAGDRRLRDRRARPRDRVHRRPAPAIATRPPWRARPRASCSPSCRGWCATRLAVEGRASMLLAAHLAGLAFATTGLGTAHAIGHALSARHGSPRGRARGGARARRGAQRAGAPAPGREAVAAAGPGHAPGGGRAAAG